MRAAAFHVSVALGAAVLGGCASTPSVRCRPGESPAVMDSLYFGTARPQGVVTAEEWQRFLAEVVTPRFKDGLTSWQASGQWRNAAGELHKESSFVIHIVHPDTPGSDASMREVMGEYKTRYEQEAVLRVRSGACMSF